MSSRIGSVTRRGFVVEVRGQWLLEYGEENEMFTHGLTSSLWEATVYRSSDEAYRAAAEYGARKFDVRPAEETTTVSIT